MMMSILEVFLQSRGLVHRLLDRELHRENQKRERSSRKTIDYFVIACGKWKNRKEKVQFQTSFQFSTSKRF